MFGKLKKIEAIIIRIRYFLTDNRVRYVHNFYLTPWLESVDVYTMKYSNDIIILPRIIGIIFVSTVRNLNIDF